MECAMRVTSLNPGMSINRLANVEEYMSKDQRSADWEVYRVRARSIAFTAVQVSGFLLVFWGLWELLGQRVLTYYDRTGAAPASLVSAANSVPGLDQLTAVLVFVAGAGIVWASTGSRQ
jgi:hypothetical protein